MATETATLYGKLLKATPTAYLVEFYGGLFLWVSRGYATLEKSLTPKKLDKLIMPMFKAQELGLVSDGGLLILPLVGILAGLHKEQAVEA